MCLNERSINPNVSSQSPKSVKSWFRQIAAQDYRTYKGVTQQQLNSSTGLWFIIVLFSVWRLLRHSYAQGQAFLAMTVGFVFGQQIATTSYASLAMTVGFVFGQEIATPSYASLAMTVGFVFSREIATPSYASLAMTV